MREKTVLGVVRADSHGAGIAVLDFDVNIADGGIERAGVSIRRRSIAVRARAGEENHVGGTLLKTRRVGGEDEGGALGAIADQADARPDVNCLGEAIAAGGDEEDALIGGFLNFIDGLLQGDGIVGGAIGLYGEFFGREVDCFGIIEARRVVGGLRVYRKS